MREVLVTEAIDAVPDHKIEWPTPTVWTFLAAVATTALFIGSIFTPWALPLGALPMAVTLIGWFWPKSAAEDGAENGEAAEPGRP
jgi:cytochrome c oxidase subunit 1